MIPQLLVIGSVAFDSVKTPHGQREMVLGGSANYASLSASYFSSVGIVAVVGEDFPEEHLEKMKSRSIDVSGIKREQGKTFHWIGEYEDINQAQTIETNLNVFETFEPILPDHYKETKLLFLANIDPDLQLKVLDQMKKPELVACDTMNFWISGKRESLLKVLKRVDLFLANEQEVFDLSGRNNILEAVEWIKEQGPSIIVVKRGEFGAMLFMGESRFWVPAFPLKRVVDPTGAGDTFAGGMMGMLARTLDFGEWNMRRAVVAGSVMASFNVEDFSVDRLEAVTPDEIMERFRAMYDLTAFDLSRLPFAER